MLRVFFYFSEDPRKYRELLITKDLIISWLKLPRLSHYNPNRSNLLHTTCRASDLFYIWKITKAKTPALLKFLCWNRSVKWAHLTNVQQPEKAKRTPTPSRQARNMVFSRCKVVEIYAWLGATIISSHQLFLDRLHFMKESCAFWQLF